MDCDRAQTAMMQYMDKQIKPAEAASLARHVLKCESCRESFLLFDAAMDVSSDEAWAVTEAPAGFTEAVMEKVRLLPAHRPVSVAKRETQHGKDTVASRVILGLCAILLGAALLLTYNYDTLSVSLADNTVFIAVSGALNAAARFLESSFNSFIQAASTQVPGMISEVSYMSLALVLMSGAILIVMQRGEKLKA